MNSDQLKSAAGQTWLAKAGYYTGAIDGDWGTLSKAAARRWLLEKQIQILAAIAPGSRQALNGIPSNEMLRTLAAQILLANLKIYGGKVDGIWGPASISAVMAWGVVTYPPNPGNRRVTPYSIAASYLGTREIPGKEHNGVILNWYRRLVISVFDDETAWCSTFVNFCCLESGYERTGKLNARSWLDLGEEIPLMHARVGTDLLIFERGTSGWEGHVTFYAGQDRGGRSVRGLGGNQNDEVNISNYSTSKLLGVRRLRSLDELQGSSNKI